MFNITNLDFIFHHNGVIDIWLLNTLNNLWQYFLRYLEQLWQYFLQYHGKKLIVCWGDGVAMESLFLYNYPVYIQEWIPFHL